VAREVELTVPSQFAVRVTLPVTLPVRGYVVFTAYVVVPSLHPANVYPVRVKVLAGAVKVEPEVTEIGVVGDAPVPSPGL
jgi:hypothetical protein